MHETPDDVAALQTLLDESYARAGAHLKTIHTRQRRMSAQEVCAAMTGVCVLNLATVRRDGAPMVAPVDGLFLKGRFWFGSAQNSLRFAHLRRDPRVSAAYTLGEEVSILVHGSAREVDTSTGDHEDLEAYCEEVYGPSFRDWGQWGINPYAWIDADRFYAIRIEAQPE